MVGRLEGHTPRAVQAEDSVDTKIGHLQAVQGMCNVLELMINTREVPTPSLYAEQVAGVMKRENPVAAKREFLGRLVAELDQHLGGAKEKLKLVPNFSARDRADVQALADRLRAMRSSAAAGVETPVTIQ